MKINNLCKIIFISSITILVPFYICNFSVIFLDINSDESRFSLVKPKISDYSLFYEGNGGDINVSLTQFLIDTSTIEISNTSDPNNNRFYEPSPTVGDFECTFVNISIEEINAPNKTIIIEDKPTGWQSIANSQVAATSFEVPAISYLTGLSTYVAIDDAQDDKCDLVARVLNSTWINGANEPDDDIAIICSAGQMSFSHFNGWLDNYSGLFSPILLDPSKTTNNTFYIELRDNGLDSDGMSWRMALDNPPTNPDNTLSYEKSGLNWDLIEMFGDYYDLNLILNITPFDEIPHPEDIGLSINGTIVSNSGIKGTGFWSPSLKLSSDSGELELIITADWWDVSCMIAKVQINYTKTDLIANSNFIVMGGGQDVVWNVSRAGGFNFFDSRLSAYEIIFKIPTNWKNIRAFNGGTNKTEDILIIPSLNGHKDIIVTNAGNGTNWYLTAKTENILESIDTYIDTNPVDNLNYTDIVRFKAKFKKKIAQDNGVINLSVYAPAAISNKLNFTKTNSTFDSGSEFYLGKWNLSETITKYGEFRVQVSWNNDSAVGFSEKILTIMGQTDLTLIAPTQDVIYYNNQSFNIILYYEDSNMMTSIDGATIYYNIDGQGWQSTSSNNGTIGYYIIPVNCNTFTTDGTKTVEITSSKVYYDNQTLNYNFNVIVVEENGGQEEPPLIINIIIIISILGGIGIVGVILIVLRKRRRANPAN